MEMGSMYIGTWWADVDTGVEYDIYAGYNFELMGIPMYAGYTGYFYSDNFDGDYQELNIGGDFGFMSVDAAVNGVYDSVDSTSKAITSQGYQHYTITVPGLMLGMPIDYSYQTFTGELTGFTHELSYGTTVSGVDVGLTLGRNSDDSTAADDRPQDKDTTYANFTLGYSF